MICFASARLQDRRCDSPKADIPYIIPKLAVLAMRLCSALTSLLSMPKIFAAVALCTSRPELKASIRCLSWLRCAMILSSICE